MSGFRYTAITNAGSSGGCCENKALISTGLIVQTNQINALSLNCSTVFNVQILMLRTVREVLYSCLQSWMMEQSQIKGLRTINSLLG